MDKKSSWCRVKYVLQNKFFNTLEAQEFSSCIFFVALKEWFSLIPGKIWMNIIFFAAFHYAKEISTLIDCSLLCVVSVRLCLCFLPITVRDDFVLEWYMSSFWKVLQAIADLQNRWLLWFCLYILCTHIAVLAVFPLLFLLLFLCVLRITRCTRDRQPLTSQRKAYIELHLSDLWGRLWPFTHHTPHFLAQGWL